MSAATTIPADHPPIAGYRAIALLSPGQSYLAAGPDGRRVVLKRLDEDCLLRGQVYPQIRDRLARVRELAMLDVATLRGVERDGDAAWLVWEYIEGRTLAERLAGGVVAPSAPPAPGPEAARAMARELVVIVAGMHAHGLVHGAVHEHNVIVDGRGRLHLTHVSPLLWDDAENDRLAVVRLVKTLVAGTGVGPACEDELEEMSLGQLAAGLLPSAAPPADRAHAELRRRQERRLRWRSWAAAAGTLLGGVALALAIWWMVR